MDKTDWCDLAKRLLKAELVKRGISTDELVERLATLGVSETKISVESKISRGTFSAVFLIQCLKAVGCRVFVPNVDLTDIVAAEPKILYETTTK